MLKVCNECGATWIDGQLYWRESGKEACPQPHHTQQHPHHYLMINLTQFCWMPHAAL